MKSSAFIPEAVIAREAAKLVHSLRAGGGSLPYDMDALVWDVLNPRDQLSLDTEIDLGCCPDTGDIILGKTVLSERKIFIAPQLVGQPHYPFTLAHEIGHWILHCLPNLQAGQTSFLETNRAESIQHLTFNRAVESPDKCRDPLEIQANIFAAHVLMPENEVRAEFYARHPQVPQRTNQESLRDFSRCLARATAGPLPPLYKLFGTSVEAMAVRLEVLKFAN